jgi:hypothetical protein
MAGDARLPHQLPENASDTSPFGREMLARVQVQRRREEREGSGGRRRRQRRREGVGKGVKLEFESPGGRPCGSCREKRNNNQSMFVYVDWEIGQGPFSSALPPPER